MIDHLDAEIDDAARPRSRELSAADPRRPRRRAPTAAPARPPAPGDGAAVLPVGRSAWTHIPGVSLQTSRSG